MREEIDAAVHFFGRVIIASNSAISNLAQFKTCLSKLLEHRFQGHWHSEVPGKGQGYRSIRLHPSEPLDPVLKLAAKDSNFNHTNFFIPVEFTLWVDPKDVSCRFGDLKATYCTVLKNEDNKAGLIDVDELLETARAVYTRQQRISIQHNNNNAATAASRPPGPPLPPPSCLMDIYQYDRAAMAMHFPPHQQQHGSPPMYHGFPDMFPPPSGHPPGSSPAGYYGYGDGGFSTPPPPFSSSPPSPPQFPPSFLSTAVNTSPRKGKGGNFRGGKGGSGRGANGSKHQQHQQQSNGDGTFNHNHNNNHNSNSNGSTPNGSGSSNNSSSSSSSNGGGGSGGGGGNGPNWNGDRYHWVRHQQQKNHQQQNQQTQQQHAPAQSAQQQNSASGKESK